MKRLLPFVFLILLVLAGIFAVPYFLQPERLGKQISTKLSTLVKRPVVVGPLSLDYLPPTLHINQVAVMNPDGTPMLQVGTALAPIDLTALLHLKFAVQAVELSQWRLDVERKADGSWDIEDFWPGATGLSGVQATALREVRWKNGEVHWMDKFAATPQDLTLSSVEGHWEPRPETLDTQGTFSSVITGTRVSFMAQGKFFASPQWSGDLQLSEQGNTAAFHLAKNPPGLDVKGQCARWSLANALALTKFYARSAPSTAASANPAMLESWQFHATLQNGRLTFDHSAGIGGGLSEAKGTVTRAASAAVLAAEFAAKDVPAGSVWELAGQKMPLDGKVTMLVKGFQMTLSTTAAATVACEGSLELRDGNYSIPESSAKKLTRAKTMAYIKQKFPGYAVKGVPITKLSVHWKAKNGVAAVDSARLVSTDIKAGWVGKVDFAKEGLDGFLRLDIREKDPKKARLIPLKYHTQPAYGRLMGTLADWQLYAVPSGRVPSSVAAKLGRALSGR